MSNRRVTKKRHLLGKLPRENLSVSRSRSIFLLHTNQHASRQTNEEKKNTRKKNTTNLRARDFFFSSITGAENNNTLTSIEKILPFVSAMIRVFRHRPVEFPTPSRSSREGRARGRKQRLDDLDSGITSRDELTRPRFSARNGRVLNTANARVYETRAIHSRYVRVRISSSISIRGCDNGDDCDDTTQVVGARDYLTLLVLERKKKGRRESARTNARVEAAGKNCAAEAPLVSRLFPAATTDVTISCIDWPGREPSRD